MKPVPICLAIVTIVMVGAVSVRASGPGLPASDPLNVVLAIDTSASDRVDLRAIREGVRRFVDGLRQGDRAGVCSFGDQLQCAAPTSDRLALLNAIGGIGSHRGTRLFDSISDAVDRLREANGRRVVIVFTTHPSTRDTDNPKDVLANARAAGVTVYAVALDVRYFDGDDIVDGRPDPDLDHVVRGTGGKLFEIDDESAIADAFRGVAREIR